MRTWLSLLFALLLSGMVAAQTHPAQNHLSHAQPKPATLMTGLGD